MANPNPTHKFKKGEINNPNGRPKKGQSLTDLLNKKLDKEKFIEELIKYAETDPVMKKYIFDRIDGKVVEKHELSSPDDKDFTIKIVKDA